MYCGQTVGWIKMALGMEVGLGPGHIVLDGDPAPPQKKGGTEPHHFSAHVCCGQTAGWIKMPLSRPHPRPHCVRWGPRSPQRGTAPHPIFGPCLLWPTGWIDQDTTWYEGSPRSRPHCVRWEPSSPKKGGTVVPTFWPMSIVVKWSTISATAEHLLN